MVGERAYSAHLFLGIPLVRSSATFQTLSIAAEGGFRAIVPPVADDGEDQAVTTKSWIQKYTKRAPELGDLSIHKIMTGYT